MASTSEPASMPYVEIAPAEEFVCTDIEVELLEGGLVRVLFFCEQRPVGQGPEARENVLRKRMITSRAVYARLIRKLEYGLAPEAAIPFAAVRQ